MLVNGPVLKKALPVAFLATFAALPANGMDFLLQGTSEPSILAKGPIIRGDVGRLRTLLARRSRPSVIYFASNGGDAAEGISLGYLLRETGMGTKIGASESCASACVFAFLGGVIREVHPTARLGVHMTSRMFVDEYIQRLKQVLLAPTTELTIDDKIRVIVALNEQNAAQFANAEVRYVLKMGVSLRLLEKATESLQFDIHWLTRSEMRDYNVTNTE